MPARLKKLRGLLSIFILVLCAGCTTIYNPATGRNENLLINTGQEVSLGKDMDRQIRRELRVFDDSPSSARLERIGKRISAASDRQDVNYVFSVVKDDDFNAFAAPGGFIYVNSGLIDAATDDELACVLAHEVGHVAARHSVKKMQAVLGYQLLVGIALGAGGVDQAVMQAVDVSFNVVALGYSRKDELLADTLSVRYTKRAGYNPQGMISFFRKLQEESRRKGRVEPLVFLSSHPPVADRIKNVEQQIALQN